jgi:hypothetical protein
MNQLNVYDPATAAALRVVLHADIAPKNYRADATGDETPTWFVRSHVPQASKLLSQRKAGVLPDGSPFLAALLAAETAHRLLSDVGSVMTWSRVGSFVQAPSLIKSAPLLDAPEPIPVPLLAPAVMAWIEREAIRATVSAKTPFPVLPLHIAAAAITCGCVPIHIAGTANQPILLLTQESVTMPGLRFSDMVKAASNDIDAANALPGHPVGEHPFLYALEAVRTAALYRYVMEQARRNTTHMFRAKNVAQRTAVVSESLLRDKRGGSFRDHLRRHLAGV